MYRGTAEAGSFVSPSSQAGAAFGGDSSPGTAACLSHSPSSPSPGWMCHLGAGDKVRAQPVVSRCRPRTLPASHPSDACTQKPPCSPRAPCPSGCSQQKVPVLSPKTLTAHVALSRETRGRRRIASASPETTSGDVLAGFNPLASPSARSLPFPAFDSPRCRLIGPSSEHSTLWPSP